MTGPVHRKATRQFGIAIIPLGAVLLGSVLLGSGGCGSVTAKRSDGGAGGSHADSSTKMDVAADRIVEDALHDAPVSRDSSSAKDMRMSDARTTDASSRGGSAGGVGGNTGGAAGGRSGAGGGPGGSGGAAGAAGGGECKTTADCMLYTGAGSGCCGVCQPASDPAPAPVECLLACLTPLKTCGCVNGLCVGSKTQL